MLEAKSCIFTPIAFGEEEFDPIPYAPDDDHRCHDCGTMPGGFHHPGCDMERCPKCSGQLISCGCLSSDD
jgi:hypothetical protein